MQCNVSPTVSAAVVSYPEATSHVTLAKEISGAGTLTCTDTEKASMVVQVSIKYRQTLLTQRMRCHDGAGDQHDRGYHHRHHDALRRHGADIK